MPDNTNWSLVFFDDDTKTEYDDYFKDHPGQDSVRVSFERDVTANPYFHPKPKRIRPLKGKHKGKFRYKKSSTRIVYHPDSTTKKIYPIETGTATDISYKKKSRKR